MQVEITDEIVENEVKRQVSITVNKYFRDKDYSFLDSLVKNSVSDCVQRKLTSVDVQEIISNIGTDKIIEMVGYTIAQKVAECLRDFDNGY